jgi:hypothetical protein
MSIDLSLVTNAAAGDLGRLQLVLPHWLSVFGHCLHELVIVFDEAPPTGRIAQLHAEDAATFDAQREAVRSFLSRMVDADSRIRVMPVPTGAKRAELIGRWFGNPRLTIDRCQAGTPILAFVAAIDAARGPIVLRADCDVLFHEAGWLAAAADLLTRGQVSLVEPARCGGITLSGGTVSSRALMLAQPAWRKIVLPLTPWRLDLLRRAHRWWHGRPQWLAFEQMLEQEGRSGRLSYAMLDDDLGCSLHVATRAEAALPMMPMVRAAMERGEIPPAQRRHGHDFLPEAWAALQGETLGQASSRLA